ncbi:hypothetical protein ACJJTC_002221 [Scirpophaga incertulas]
MRPHAPLLLALLAATATIQSPVELDTVKKLPEIIDSPNNAPQENIVSEQELLDSANSIKDVENNLRVKAVDSIPVKVIVDQPDEGDVNFKRVEIDLNSPGEPQRQEHETQNPVHYEEQKIVTSVKQTVSDTEAALKQGFQGVAQGIQDWISNNEQLTAIQQSIQGLQQSFTSQLSKLNETIQTFWSNQDSENVIQTDQPSKPVIESVENQIKTLEDNFKIGVKALSEGVEVFATLKQDNSTPQNPAPPNNLFTQYLQMFQQTITQGFSNVTQAFQNYVSQNNNGTGLLQGINTGIQSFLNPGQGTTPSGVQSDEATTARPTIWQGIQNSLQNILNPGQNQAPASDQNQNPATPNRPIAQAIQNLPFVQGVVNFIQPVASQPTKPAEPAGSNVVPASTDSKPDAVPVKAPESQEASSAPIRNIIQNSPIVKGIQKLQASISNPEKPRDAAVEQSKDASGESKGHGGGSGNNNDSSVSDVADKGEAPAQPENNIKKVEAEKVKENVQEANSEIKKTDQS